MTMTKVLVKPANRWVNVKITSSDKPEIGREIKEKWQAIIDLVA